jgi:ABC-type lipoprotein export system ATPase subunit
VTTRSIVFRSVTKTYRRAQRRITALQNVSFEMLQGELALVVGPSGSGKTTLFNLIAALDQPDSGEIIVAGSEITRLSRSAAAHYRNERIGFVFQSYNCSRSLRRSKISFCQCSPNTDWIFGAQWSSSTRSASATEAVTGLRN